MEYEECRAFKIKGENGLCVGDKRKKRRCSVCPCYIREQAIIAEERDERNRKVAFKTKGV